MNADAMVRYVNETFDGVWAVENLGDTYFMYAPDGALPPQRQHPFATLVTGDRHDHASNLDRPDTYRLNIGLTRATYVARFGPAPTERLADGSLLTGSDYTALDTLMPHPVYASQYWVCVLNPGEATLESVRAYLAEAHGFAARKYANHRARQPG
jgi:hypothetical protein